MYKFEALSYPADPPPPAVDPPSSCPLAPAEIVWTLDGASKVRRQSICCRHGAACCLPSACLVPAAKCPAAPGRA
jgi:hypothetical protein